MHIARDVILVARWTCAVCGKLNYHPGRVCMKQADTEEDRAALLEIADEMGCDPGELAEMPDMACCIHCEETHEFVDPDTLS